MPEIVALPRASVAVLVFLTPAGRKVVLRLARGLSNKEIAHDLGKSAATVKNQLASVYRKLGVRNRIRLIMMFQS